MSSNLGTASVVLAVRDAAATVEQQLQALHVQDYSGSWEVVVVDNGSRDGTPERVAAWQDRLPLKLVSSGREPSGARSRNLGVLAATGGFLVFCDGDDVVSRGWLKAMVSGLEHESLATGPLEYQRLNSSRPVGTWPDPGRSAPPTGYGFLPYAMGCSLGTRRDLFDALGGFSTDFRSGYDVDYSWRAQLAGHQVGFCPGAVVHRRLQPGLRAQCRRQVRYARSAPLLYKRYRGTGMPRSPLNRALAHWGVLLITSPLAGMPRRRPAWSLAASHRLGRLIGSAEHRTIFL